MLRTPPVLTEELLLQITQVADKRLPIEACGVILPTDYRGVRVIELPNRSMSAQDSFVVFSADMRVALHEWLHDDRTTEEDALNLTLWHSHPAGGVGPSRTDMKNRVVNTETGDRIMHHLVIALTDAGWVPSWY